MKLGVRVRNGHYPKPVLVWAARLQEKQFSNVMTAEIAGSWVLMVQRQSSWDEMTTNPQLLTGPEWRSACLCSVSQVWIPRETDSAMAERCHHWLLEQEQR